jgi:hypothetical protein
VGAQGCAPRFGRGWLGLSMLPSRPDTMPIAALSPQAGARDGAAFEEAQRGLRRLPYILHRVGQQRANRLSCGEDAQAS